MNRSTLLALLVGAVALTFAVRLYAQTDDSNEGTVPPTNGAGFVDENGINENVARMHMRGVFARHQRQEVRGLIANLTDEQKTELKATIENLKAEGATPEQIHAAIGEKLQSYGVTLPADWNQTPQEFTGRPEFRGLTANLTDEQKAELKAAIEALEAEGATPEQIHTAIGEKLQSFGVTLPADWNMTPEERVLADYQRREVQKLMANLTDDQKTQLNQAIDDLKAQGATWEQIHAAVGDKLQSFGVTLPTDWNQTADQFMAQHALTDYQRGELHSLTANLTADQKAQLKQTFDDLKAQGATPDQIRAAVGEKLQSFGVTLPADWSQTADQFAQQYLLSSEQRSELQSLVQTMRAQGSTRDEIRAAVQAKYQEWGKAMLPESGFMRRGIGRPGGPSMRGMPPTEQPEQRQSK